MTRPYLGWDNNIKKRRQNRERKVVSIISELDPSIKQIACQCDKVLNFLLSAFLRNLISAGTMPQAGFDPPFTGGTHNLLNEPSRATAGQRASFIVKKKCKSKEIKLILVRLSIQTRKS